MDIDSVIERIKKAVRLARGTSEAGERETALRLARSLAERNSLAFSEVEDESAADAAVSVTDAKERRTGGDENAFANSLIRHHFGVVVLTNMWGDGKVSYTWFGTRLNIDIARHVHHILLRESRKAWRELRDSLKSLDVGGRKHKRAFMHGFFSAVWSKLDAHPLRNDRDVFEAEKKAAESKFARYKENNKVEMARLKTASDENAVMLLSGFGAGKKVALARPCEGASSSPLSLTA